MAVVIFARGQLFVPCHQGDGLFQAPHFPLAFQVQMSQGDPSVFVHVLQSGEQGEQLRAGTLPCPGQAAALVIPWTASAGLDKAALAEHIRRSACFPTALTRNQALIRLKCKVKVSAAAMSTSLCSRNVVAFLFCTTSTIVYWAGGTFSQSGLAKSLELEPENTGLWD